MERDRRTNEASGSAEGCRVMGFLDKITIKTKFTIILVLSVFSLLITGATSASLLRDQMVEERIDKVKDVVATMISQAERLDAEVAQGQRTRQDAQTLVLDTLNRAKYDDGTGYVIAMSDTGVWLANAVAPEKVGSSVASLRDATGQPLGEKLLALGRLGEGTLAYTYHKPGSDTPQPKISYVQRFAPWGIIFISGVYRDDLDQSFFKILGIMSALSFGVILMTGSLLLILSRGITRPLESLKEKMVRLAHNEWSVTLEEGKRRSKPAACPKRAAAVGKRAQDLCVRPRSSRRRTPTTPILACCEFEIKATAGARLLVFNNVSGFKNSK
nr:cache domain-containing protein [Pararhodospirillum photometricum]